MRAALAPLTRFIATPRHAKHRLFVWLAKEILPDSALVAIAREDDYFFGVLHSYAHEIWSLRMGTSLEDRPRYTPTTTFETFPFPWPPGSEPPDNHFYRNISEAAKVLNAEREAWLNPPDMDLPRAKGDSVEKLLKDRTLTNLYNAVEAYREQARALNPAPQTSKPSNTASFSPRPEGEGSGVRVKKPVKLTAAAKDFAPRLAALHDALDAAVLAAYGWEDLVGRLRTAEGDEELLRRLLAENLRRARK
jgi:hypothetical protein